MEDQRLVSPRKKSAGRQAVKMATKESVKIPVDRSRGGGVAPSADHPSNHQLNWKERTADS